MTVIATLTELTITDRDLERGLALANTPSGEVVVHIKDARLPLWTEGEKLPQISHRKLFLHSDTHLPEIGDIVVAEVHQGRNEPYAYWCPKYVWDDANERYQVVLTDNHGDECVIWQGKGILNLSLLFRSTQEMSNTGCIHIGPKGRYTLSIIENGEEFIPDEDPRLTADMLPYDLVDGITSYFTNYQLDL